MNNNTEKEFDNLIQSAFDSFEANEIDDATLDTYLASSSFSRSARFRRGARGFIATAACLALVLGGGLLIKDKLAKSNSPENNNISAPATNVDNDSNQTPDETPNEDSPITEEFLAKREAAWEEFTKDKMKLIVMEGQVTELGIVGYRCMVAKDYDIARQGTVVDIRLETYVESYNGRIPYSANEAGEYEYCVVKPGSVIFVNIPEATDSIYPMIIPVSEESNPVYVLPDFNAYFVPSDLLYAPTTLEHLPASTFGLKGVNTYVNENELYKMLEVINSGEDTTYAFTIAEKDYSFIIGAYNKENINNPMYNLVNLMYDNNYGITTYYDILYSNDHFTIRIDSTEMNIFPELDAIHTPYTMNFYYMHVVEDYKGTGSKCIYFSNDETPMNGEELVQFLDSYNNPDDYDEYADITENYLVVMQSHLGVNGLRGGELDNNKETDEDSEPMITLAPDESLFQSEDELLKSINTSNKENIKNITHYYMPNNIPENWYIDNIFVNTNSMKVQYKYVKDNTVSNVGDYSFTWERQEQGTTQEESVLSITTLEENGNKNISWYEDGFSFSATVPADVGIDEIINFTTLRKEIVK